MLFISGFKGSDSSKHLDLVGARGSLGGFQVDAIDQLGGLRPKSVGSDRLQKPLSSKIRAAVSCWRIEFRMPWKLDHVLGQRDGCRRSSDVEPIADQPFVVVGIVMDLVGHDPIADHVRVIDARRGFLLPSRIGIAIES